MIVFNFSCVMFSVVHPDLLPYYHTSLLWTCIKRPRVIQNNDLESFNKCESCIFCSFSLNFKNFLLLVFDWCAVLALARGLLISFLSNNNNKRQISDNFTHIKLSFLSLYLDWWYRFLLKQSQFKGFCFKRVSVDLATLYKLISFNQTNTNLPFILKLIIILVHVFIKLIA